MRRSRSRLELNRFVKYRLDGDRHSYLACDEDFGPGPQDLGRRRFDRDLFSNSSGKEIVGQVSNDGLDDNIPGKEGPRYI